MNFLLVNKFTGKCGRIIFLTIFKIFSGSLSLSLSLLPCGALSLEMKATVTSGRGQNTAEWEEVNVQL